MPSVPHPEVRVGQALAVELRAEQARHQPADHAEGEEAVPAQTTDVHVRDGPVGEVAQAVEELGAEQRTFQRAHAVGRHGHHHELQDGVLTHAVPGAAQGEQNR